MATVLDTIMDYKRREVEAAKATCPADVLRARAEAASPVRPFAGASVPRHIFMCEDAALGDDDAILGHARN